MVAVVPRTVSLDEADLARIQVYSLLARLLARPPEAGLLDVLRRLPGDDTPLGLAFAALAREAAAISPDQATREYEALFIGVVRGDVVPYASYYLTGFLNDRPLARLRGDLAALGLERSPGVVEPEDHLASLCEVMAELIAGRFGDPIAADGFFDRHLRPWAARCFSDIEHAPSARLYRPAGAIGRLFLTLEGDVVAPRQKQWEETHHAGPQSS